MLPNGRRLGAHLPLGHGMVKAADRAAEIGASALQVFSDNPTSWHRRPTLRRASCRRSGTASPAMASRPLAIHAPYLVNLAGPDTETHRRSVDVLANELRVAGRTGRAFVNVHVGSHRGEGPAAGIARLAPGAPSVVDAAWATPHPMSSSCSRTAPGAASGWARRSRSSAPIDQAVTAAGVARERYGVLPRHGAPLGRRLPDATRRRAWTRPWRPSTSWSAWAAAHGPPQRLARRSIGSRVDRHEHVGAGRIGAARASRRMVTHPALDHVVYYLETPGMDDGLRRGQHRARRGPGARTTAGCAPARRVPHAQHEGPQRAAADDDGPGGRPMTPAARRRRRARARRPARDPGPGRPHAPAGHRRAWPLGRRPGTRHARPPRHGGRRRGPAARPEDVDRDVPPRGRLLLPAGARGDRVSGRPGGGDRARSRCSGSPPWPATWWLARLVGGPLAAAAAGLLAAISPAGIDESTFIWNPNLIPRGLALAFAGAVMARQTGQARWWLLAAIGAMVTMQCHVLGVVIVVPLAWAWGSDLVRRRRAGQPTAGLVRGGLGALAIIAAGFLPLLVHELGHGLRRDPRDPRVRGGRRARGRDRGPRPDRHGRAALDHVAA